jgi:transcriptional regulator with XRE-family HTH domain
MAELDRAAISVRIAEARDKRAGLTQPELADLMKVHWRTIQDWESPKNNTVPWDRLGEIASATGVSKEWLLHGEIQSEITASEVMAKLDDISTQLTALDRKLDAMPTTEDIAAAVQAQFDALSRREV